MSSSSSESDLQSFDNLLSNVDSNDEETLTSELKIQHQHTRVPVRDDVTDLEVASMHSNKAKSLRIGFWESNKGGLLVILSMFFAASMDMAARILEMPPLNPYHLETKPLQTIEILFVRHVFTLGGILVYGFIKRLTHHGEEGVPDFPLGDYNIRGLLIARGIAGFVAVFGIYFSLPYLHLTEATVLTFMAPILTCYANIFLIKGETFTITQQIASGVSLLGVIFIAVLAGSTEQSNTQVSDVPEISARSVSKLGVRHVAIAIAFLGVFGQAGGMVFTRMIGARAHPLIILLYSSTASVVFCGFAILTLPEVTFTPSIALEQWLLLMVVTACGFLFQLLLTKGLQYGASSTRGIEEDEGIARDEGTRRRFGKPKVTVNRAVTMMYTQAVFALLYDWTIWHTLPSLMSWIGMALIAAGALWIAFTNH